MLDGCNEKENMTSAAEVNLMKAEEYRESLRTGSDKKKKQKNGKKFVLLVAGAAIIGILAATIFQGIHW